MSQPIETHTDRVLAWAIKLYNAHGNHIYRETKLPYLRWERVSPLIQSAWKKVAEEALTANKVRVHRIAPMPSALIPPHFNEF